MNPRIEAFKGELERLADRGAFDVEAEGLLSSGEPPPADLEAARAAVVDRLMDVWLDTGWALITRGSNGLTEIQRDDEAGVFDSDHEAIAYVAARATAGSSRHADAMAVHAPPDGKDTARALADRLFAKYPDLQFDVMGKADVGEDDDSPAPALIVTFGRDECIVDPFSGEDGRFPAHPTLDHGISVEDAIAIRDHNKICLAVKPGEDRERADELLLDRAVDAALNAGCKVLQDALGVKTGDFAGVYWSGPIGPGNATIREAFAAYLEAERAEAARRSPGDRDV
jgi:hypothetical protein